MDMSMSMSMTFESWIAKLIKSAVVPSKKKRSANLGILAFEAAAIVSRLLHLWRALSDAALARLRRETIRLPGVRRVVSDDDDVLLSLACAELADSLRHAADAAAAALAPRCADPALREFRKRVKEFADSSGDGAADHSWVMSAKEMQHSMKKMDRLVASTAALFTEMEELAEAEACLRRLARCGGAAAKLAAAVEVRSGLFGWAEVEHLSAPRCGGRRSTTRCPHRARGVHHPRAIKRAFGIVPDASRSPNPVAAAVYPSPPRRGGRGRG
ncbi:hypothetical protein ACMD2_25016 [Ananas comosus]|uniref:DUF3475 domain-containing protein n=1 Tax=Ananas comosus TaxID=4615 RepID=A0A199UL04_ANACO|nr:hypothetical protein ACMD2_25016 [Ananas comosus]